MCVCEIVTWFVSLFFFMLKFRVCLSRVLYCLCCCWICVRFCIRYRYIEECLRGAGGQGGLLCVCVCDLSNVDYSVSFIIGESEFLGII